MQQEQQEFQFDFGSVEATSNARLEFSVKFKLILIYKKIFLLQKIRNRLESYAIQIEDNIHNSERLCVEGAETLTPEQFHKFNFKIIFFLN